LGWTEYQSRMHPRYWTFRRTARMVAA
jgi:hypothetical protein